MKVERLKKLRKALVAYNKNRKNLGFNLTTWAAMDFIYESEDPTKVVQAARDGKNYCGTTACACGIATTVPEFRRAGLKIIRTDCGAELSYRGKREFDAAESFFGLSDLEAEHLFYAYSYPESQRKSPMAVVRRIDKMLKGATK
jgi:hypothetical protein